MHVSSLFKATKASTKLNKTASKCDEAIPHSYCPFHRSLISSRMCRPLFLPAVTVQSNGIAFAAPGVYGMTETLEAPAALR